MTRQWYLSLSFRRWRRQGFRKLIRHRDLWQETFYPVLPGLWLVKYETW